MAKKNFLKDQVFLNKLDNLRIKKQFVKITILSWDEEPIQEIQGKVISGSLNVDGSSSLRRTCNMSFFAEEYINDLTQINELLSINRKVKLELGIVNTVPVEYNEVFNDSDNSYHHYEINYQDAYGDIVWFPLGIYVMFDPNISHATSGVTITMSLKDKMCLLNGDAGGTLPTAVTLHERDQVNDDGTVTVTKPTISQIIREVVNHFGKENLSKIIISDLDERIKSVARYMGNTPLYYVLNGKYYYTNQSEALEAAGGSSDGYRVFNYGDDIGYVLTNFTYPGELVSDIGETVTDVLDKIIQILGNYEYFYDVYGNFHFQEIKNYLNTTYTTQVLKDNNDNELVGVTEIPNDFNPSHDIDLSSGRSVYTFEGTKLISSFNNAPSYSNIKNDFMVWGVKKSMDGTETPIRYHLAIDDRPIKQNYTSSGNININNNAVVDTGGTVKGTTWYPKTEDLLFVSAGAFTIGKSEEAYGKHINIVLKKDEFGNYYAEKGNPLTTTEPLYTIYTKDWREELYYQGVEAEDTGTDYNYYYTELKSEWPKLYDLVNQKFKDSVQRNPNQLDFFLDMVDSNTEIGKYSVNNIGRRSIAVSDDEINCVFENDIPDMVLFPTEQNEDEETKQLRLECQSMGQDYVQVDPGIYDLISVGGTQNSCYQRINEMLYQYTTMTNTISIQSIPIYYLEPNTRITVHDPASGIFGDYIISNMSVPLDINGMLQINAYKAISKL